MPQPFQDQHFPETRATLRYFAALFFGCLVAVIIVYGNVPILFLRCESGEWLRVSHLPEPAQRAMLHGFWTNGIRGHYTPLAFCGEFFFTKLANTNAWIWRARQLVGLALLAACFFHFARSLALLAGLRKHAALCIAVGLSAAFLFQPPIKDLVAWPFHILQLLWLILTLLTMTSLLALLTRPAPKWVWFSVATSYASMQVLGLGFVTWCGCVTLISILLAGAYTDRWPAFQPLRQTLARALLALAFLGIVHAFCMFWLTQSPPTTGAPPGHFRVLHALGLVAIYPLSVLLNFFGILPTSFAGIPHAAESAAPYGILLLGTALAGLGILTRSAFSADHSTDRLHLGLHAFSFVCGLAFIAMLSVREILERGVLDDDIYKYFVDSRYVVPFSLILLGSALWLLFRLLRNRAQFATLFFVALAVSSLLAHFHFEREVRPRVLANNSISHGQVWKLIVATALECRAASLPIPDIPMENFITFSPETRLSHFEPILHDSLRLPSAQRCEFISWEESRGAARAEYDSAAPSLQRVMALLRLK